MVGKLESHGHGLIRGDLRFVLASSQQEDGSTDNSKSPLSVGKHSLSRAAESIHLITSHELGVFRSWSGLRCQAPQSRTRLLHRCHLNESCVLVRLGTTTHSRDRGRQSLICRRNAKSEQTANCRRMRGYERRYRDGSCRESQVSMQVRQQGSTARSG